MMRFGFLALSAVLLAGSAAAQSSRNFPFDKPFRVISISGFDVQKQTITFTVSKTQKDGRYQSSGNAGCNNWFAGADVRDDQFEVSELGTTKKMCTKPMMKTEEAFLTTLKSAHKWKLDDKGRLIVEGEAGRLLLTSVGADGKKR
ncbi:MAG: META domain-containing protein [Pseudomonadota bacterium]